jgi:ATP-dependent Clp protease adaptor protein ClpS
MNDVEREQPDVGIVTEEMLPELKPPQMYQVIIYNDDFTPMDFVVEILRIFFYKSQAKASEIMFRVHSTGKAVCGVYTKNVAETKVSQVRAYSQQNEYPLRCDMQPIDH